MNKRVGPYEIEQICPAVWAVDTDADESLYLVCGSERAYVIDTGSAAEPLMPLIRSLWDGPAELLLTHAHFDHMYRSDEFSSVSLLDAEIAAWAKTLGPIVWISSAASGKCPKRYPVKTWRALRDADALDLGGKTLRVIAARGHTPGSMILADEEDGLLFTGDAFGSGSFAWMWMPGCSCLSAYRDSLRELLVRLAPYRDFRMLGGHRRQGVPTQADPHARPLTYATVADMEKLCGEILGGSLAPESEERNFSVKNYLYRYGDAAIVLTKEKIK
ncbi:MAG: MBL fold metallo-hydrolase [Oscillospiraceae bacterium]|nr:MBL fold metallo-hydrolase [Oscillospiraceae bacterium]